MKVRAIVRLRPDVLDPQGKAIEHSLKAMQIKGVNSVRQGKVFDLELNARDKDDARKKGEELCQKLLANGVIEDFEIEVMN